VGGIIFYVAYGKDIFAMQEDAIKLVSDSTEQTFRAAETSIAYNSKGNQVAILRGEKDVYYLKYADIPQWAIDAMIISEDRKFYSHGGIDVYANLRAVQALIQNNGEITQGASTITQQIARTVFLTTAQNYSRKMKEIFIALELEKKYSKNQIMEFYFNNIYFANGYYGIEAASKGYFSKSSSELTLGEICFLCSIPNNPKLYNPIQRKENTENRKKRILDQMLEEGAISNVEYDEAYHQKIKLNIQEVKSRNYIQTFITRCATREIMKTGGFTFRNQFESEEEEASYNELYDDEYAAAQKKLFSAGYRIYTSIDLSIQKKLQKAVNSNLSQFKEKNQEGIYEMQGAAACIDNKDGRVVAIVGGRSQKTEGYTLNRGYQTYRQPGSSIKPLIVYTPSLERDYSADSYVEDKKKKGGPSNDDGTYSGTITLRSAVERSRNTVAWELYRQLTPAIGLQYLLDMGFARIAPDDYYLASSLGGLTYGCSPVEMASGYSTIENDGKFREPTCIIKILDANGQEIVSDRVKENEVYSAPAANEMVDILEGVFVNGTARGLALPDGMACAGKTGTTNDKKDGWFCGFTPYYTAAVWIGYDQPREVADLYGATYPGRTWNTFMTELHEDLERRQFTLPYIEEKAKPTPQPWSPPTEDDDNDDSNNSKKNDKPKRKRKSGADSLDIDFPPEEEELDEVDPIEEDQDDQDDTNTGDLAEGDQEQLPDDEFEEDDTVWQ
jgi:membrane peptidoglycan carboxypeptidase